MAVIGSESGKFKKQKIKLITNIGANSHAGRQTSDWTRKSRVQSDFPRLAATAGNLKNHHLVLFANGK